jgi:hypothetical protein
MYIGDYSFSEIIVWHVAQVAFMAFNFVPFVSIVPNAI